MAIVWWERLIGSMCVSVFFSKTFPVFGLTIIYVAVFFLIFFENAKDCENFQINAMMINDHVCFTSLNLLCIYIYW